MRLARTLFGTAIVLVTHNIGVIKAMADTMLVMKDGEIWEYGSVPSVLKIPRPIIRKTIGGSTATEEVSDGRIIKGRTSP